MDKYILTEKDVRDIESWIDDIIFQTTHNGCPEILRDELIKKIKKNKAYCGKSHFSGLVPSEKDADSPTHG